MNITSEHVTFDGRKATIGDSLTLFGGHHWGEESLEELAGTFDDIKPDVIAHESSRVTFAIQQMFRPNVDSLRVLEYVLRNDIDLALIDMDWDPIYENYPQDKIDALLDEASNQVGFEDGQEPETIEDARLMNDKLNDIDNDFYTQFIVQRDLLFARRLVWLTEHYETILGTIGFAHIESVAGIVADMLFGDDAGLTPQEPTLYEANELLDIVATKDEILTEARRNDAPVDPQQIEMVFDSYRSEYKKAVTELYQNPV